MNNEMRLEKQICCMKQMREDLGEFCVIMRGAMDSFQDDIKYLRSVGFSVETEEQYQKSYYTPANNDVEQVISDIQHQHFDYIDRVIEKLEELLHEQ
jgi:hypothetical protein